MNQQKLWIGAHTSAAGGAPNALRQAQEIEGTTFQLFTSNQKQWEGRAISQLEVDEWQTLLQETGMQHVMSHASYLINLGSPDAHLLEKSRQAIRSELQRCHALNIPYLNVHPGAATKGSLEQCLDAIVASLLSMEDLVHKGKTRLLLETTAGQGTSVGHAFEQLGYLVHRTHAKIPIGICIDTCHIFVAGYDVRTPLAWKQVLAEFDEKIGLQHLFAFHLNDSAKEFGSRVDRHASLGKGHIGLDCFRFLMTAPETRHLPKYLETPEGPPVWKQEIELLRKFAEEYTLLEPYAHKN